MDALGILSIRTGMFEERTARVVLDTRGELPAYDVQAKDSVIALRVSR